MKRKSDRIPQRTVTIVLNRSKMSCENPKCSSNQTAHFHHIFFRSQYFGSDKHEAWNIAHLCEPCHSRIHHLGGGLWLNLYLKRLALKRFHGKDDNKKKLERIIQPLKYKYDKEKGHSEDAPRARKNSGTVYEDCGDL